MSDNNLITPAEIAHRPVRTLWDECKGIVLGGTLTVISGGLGVFAGVSSLASGMNVLASLSFALYAASLCATGYSVFLLKRQLSRYAAPQPPANG